MNQEIRKLSTAHPRVIKSVTATIKRQQKTIQIKNWKDELKVFTDADINKSSWIGYFKVIEENLTLQYIATKKEIPIKKIGIFRNAQGKIEHLRILAQENNWLYQSKDTLDYFPDSLYSIRKWQKTRFLKENSYQISSKILYR